MAGGSNYLSGLLARARGELPVLEPRRRSRFELSPYAQGSDPAVFGGQWEGAGEALPGAAASGRRKEVPRDNQVTATPLSGAHSFLAAGTPAVQTRTEEVAPAQGKSGARAEVLLPEPAPLSADKRDREAANAPEQRSQEARPKHTQPALRATAGARSDAAPMPAKEAPAFERPTNNLAESGPAKVAGLARAPQSTSKFSQEIISSIERGRERSMAGPTETQSKITVGEGEAGTVTDTECPDPLRERGAAPESPTPEATSLQNRWNPQDRAGLSVGSVAGNASDRLEIVTSQHEPGMRRSGSPRARSSESAAMAEAAVSEPAIHVHIGRVEVRAAQLPAVPVHPRRPAIAKLSLQEYLTRGEGQR